VSVLETIDIGAALIRDRVLECSSRSVWCAIQSDMPAIFFDFFYSKTKQAVPLHAMEAIGEEEV
jgi:hypothetical protein